MLKVERTSRTWTAVAVAMLALGFAALPVFLIGALSIQIQAELGFGGSELGLTFAMFFVAAALSSAVMGRLSERLGSRSALRAAILLSSFALLGIGLLGSSLFVIGAFAALAGVSGAIVHPASNLLLAQAVPRRWLGFSFGVKQSGIPVATLLAGLAVPTFALTIGWRWAFVAGAVVACLVAVNVPNPAMRDLTMDPVPAGRASLPTTHMIVLTVGLGCGTAGATSLGAFGVPTMVDAGVSEGVAGLVIALASIVGIAARITVGLLADRRPGTEVWMMATMLLTGGLAYAVLAGGQPTWTYGAVLVAFGAGWGWLGLFDLAIVRLNSTAPGAATGVTKTGAFLGGIVGPSTLGAVVDRGSFASAWLVATGFAVVASACMAAVAWAHRERHPDAGAARVERARVERLSTAHDLRAGLARVWLTRTQPRTRQGEEAMEQPGDRRNGMIVDWDVPIEMDDGITVRADVFRPDDESAEYPVILSYGPYAKGFTFQDGYTSAWDLMVERYPEVAEGSTNRYQAWEVADPEKWVPDGYVCVRVDARGWGRSPGNIDPMSPRETQDLYDCIEWGARQSWSTGKVGLAGISYFAINQWHVAGLKPPHLTAMVPWEGMGDFYRDWSYHGGIFCTSVDTWYSRVIASVQHGRGSRGPTNPNTGELACGPETLSDEALAASRSDFVHEVKSRPLDGPFYQERSGHWERIDVPFLSAGNWGGHGLHLRGNVEAFVEAASEQKWLEIHGGEHWTGFYTDRGIALQKRFFDHFLKGVDNGWADEPRVQLVIRHVDGRFVERGENEWPIARTRWTPLYVDPRDESLRGEQVSSPVTVSFEALGEGVTFATPPFEEETEITGPVTAKLFVSSSTTDADLFLVLRVFSPDDEEIVFQGAVDPHHPIAQGWLRVSHRKLDPARSRPYRPYHAHDERLEVEPGEVYEVDVEIWPTSIVIPPSYRLALSVRGKDYEYSGAVAELSHFKGSKMRGSGIYVHDDSDERPVSVYGGVTTIHAGPTRPSHVVLPIVPSETAATEEGDL